MRNAGPLAATTEKQNIAREAALRLATLRARACGLERDCSADDHLLRRIDTQLRERTGRGCERRWVVRWRRWGGRCCPGAAELVHSHEMDLLRAKRWTRRRSSREARWTACEPQSKAAAPRVPSTA